MIEALLVDLDDTLYEYAPCESAARAALVERFVGLTGASEHEAKTVFAEARASVKKRCATPSGHGRLLYVHEMLHEAMRVATGSDEPRGATLLEQALVLEEAYWSAYLETMVPRPFAHALLEQVRARGLSVAIVTDLTLAIQLRKLKTLGLFGLIDALVASEEVGADKPARAAFELGAARLGVPLERCAVIGDNDEKDGEGARRLGIPFFHARTDATGVGLGLEQIRDEIFRRNQWTS